MRLLKIPGQGRVLSTLKSIAALNNTILSKPRQKPTSLCWHRSLTTTRQLRLPKIYTHPIRVCNNPRVFSTVTFSSAAPQPNLKGNNRTTKLDLKNRPENRVETSVFAKMSYSSTACSGELRDGSGGSQQLKAMEVATNIFAHAVSSVLPHQMIEKNLSYNAEKSSLRIAGREYRLKQNVHVVGFGKAVLGMARALEDCIGDHVVGGVVSIPVGSRDALEKAGLRDMLLPPSSKIRVMEGAADNLPDEAAYQAAQEISRTVKAVGADDLLVVLISGGGSALLPYPEPPLTLEDTLTVTRLLARSGANILDLNRVRKVLEHLKGGGIARLARPAKVVSLIMSDVIGDDLGFIASGPTVHNFSTPQKCLNLFKRYNVMASVPAPVLSFLETKASINIGTVEEDFSHVSNVLIGTNRIACDAACSKSSELGFLPYVLSTELSGEAKTIGAMFAVLAEYIAGVAGGLGESNQPKSKETQGARINRLDVNTKLRRARLMSEFSLPENTLREIEALVLQAQQTRSARGVCIVAGGETTVTVRGKGKGGRNQEMAVAAGVELHTLFHSGSTTSSPSPAGSAQSAENSAFIRRFGSFKPPQGPSQDINVATDVTTDTLTAQDLVFLSAGTDGQDGPTSAAGGWVDGDFLQQAREAGLDVADYLNTNDSFTLLTKLGEGSNLVVTGLTGTNVMDLQILVAQLR